jgi:hypothetical protein
MRGFSIINKVSETGTNMEAELTLTLDETIIETARQYAENNNRSLSKLVEGFFKDLIVPNLSKKRHSPLVESLTGVLSEEEVDEWAKEDPRVRYILTKEI